MSNIGESWEISGLEENQSIVSEGEYKGFKINELIRMFGPELVGERVFRKYGYSFPLLLKIIDAREDLSVQVHPDDHVARSLGHPFGKTELWYVIEAESDAKIFSGFEERITPPELIKNVLQTTLMSKIMEHQSKKGRIFFLPAGQVHAIGAGNLIVEIQQACDVTYRIYDHGRVGLDGKPRQLHIDESLEAIDFTPGSYVKDCEETAPGIYSLMECDKFKCLQINVKDKLAVENRFDSFMILTAIEGDVKIISDDFESPLTKGHSILLPASIKSFSVVGTGRLLVFTA